MVLASGKFNVSVLSQDAEFSLFKHFGFQSGRDVDKFADFKDADHAENGIAFITKGTNAYFSAEVEPVSYTHLSFCKCMGYNRNA